MATDKITNVNANIEAQFPDYSNYVDLSSKAAGSTFTVDRTGFYLAYVNPQTSAASLFSIRKSGQYVAIVNPIGGSPATNLCYLTAGVTYTILHKANVQNAYLYY